MLPQPFLCNCINAPVVLSRDGEPFVLGMLSMHELGR